MTKAFRTEIEYVPVECREEKEVHLEVGHEKIKSGFIQGTVRCETTGKRLPNILVRAINKDCSERAFFAITNKHGFYALSVPLGKYIVFALQCSNKCFSGQNC